MVSSLFVNNLLSSLCFCRGHPVSTPYNTYQLSFLSFHPIQLQPMQFQQLSFQPIKFSNASSFNRLIFPSIAFSIKLLQERQSGGQFGKGYNFVPFVTFGQLFYPMFLFSALKAASRICLRFQYFQYYSWCCCLLFLLYSVCFLRLAPRGAILTLVSSFSFQTKHQGGLLNGWVCD